MDDDKKLNLNRPLLSVRRRGVQKCEEMKIATVEHLLPPHRSDLKSGPVRDPGVVPFLWEHTPGQPKEDVTPLTSIAPPGRSIESSREETSSDSGDSDEAYVDARDTLSRTESFSLNCSMSGLSVQGKGLPVSVSKDVHVREFMMDRFLPAAKAIASETTPQYLTKTQNVVQQQDQCKKPSLRYGPSFAKRYSHYQEKEEEQDSDDDCDRHQDLPAACGLLPRFCFRSSLCLLNPVPAMSVRTRSRKQVDKIQAAEVDDHKTKSRRNECGRSEPGDGRVPRWEVKEVIDIPELKIHSGTKGFVSDGKGFEAFEESKSETSVINKTLYIDTVHVVESLNLDTTDSSHDDYCKKLKTVNGDKESLPHAPEQDAFSTSSSIDKPNGKCRMEFPKTQVPWRDSALTENGKCLEKQQDYSGHPIPPPLPKSPSDSWLCRTLPSMATKKLSLRLYPQNQFYKSPTSDIIVVQTTKESLTTISET